MQTSAQLEGTLSEITEHEGEDEVLTGPAAPELCLDFNQRR